MKTGSDTLGFQIHTVERLLRKRFEQRGAQYGLSSAQWRLLFMLHREPGISQARLAEVLEVEPISVSRLLDRMQQAGWIERREDTDDRRVRTVHPTPKALEGFETMRGIAAELFEEALQGLSSDERATVRHGLAKIIENLSAGEGVCPTAVLQEA